MITEEREKSLMLDILAKHLDAGDIKIHSCNCRSPKHLIEVFSEDGNKSLYGSNIEPHITVLNPKKRSGIVYWTIEKTLECLDCNHIFPISTENINF